MTVTYERCDECGFDGSQWTDTGAIDEAETLPGRWQEAITGLSADELQQRPISDMWSIAEYTDHVRETGFGMRFVLDTVIRTPGVELGDPPEPAFDPDPRRVDTVAALAGFGSEISQLCAQLRDVPAEALNASCTIAGDTVDVHWIARHIVHDVTHHLGDLARLRAALRSR